MSRPPPGSPPAGGNDVNPALVRVARDESRYVRDDSRRPRGKGGGGRRTVSYGSGAYGGAAHRSRTDGSGHRPRSLHSPGRPEIVELLDRAALLPAIMFIFSRAGCEGAVRQMLGSGLRLTSPAEQREIAAIIERHTVGLSGADLRALDYDRFAEAMTRGIAAHHAGMLPTFKECVEEAFVRGLIKVVFATETLALGINMPARSVVLEKLVKYNGETHADITPGEYTQLTGRAGRRGIDVEGHAVVVWQPGLDPRAVAGLASRRTYPLRSSFAPTYNMAVNLVSSVGRDRARTLLEQSFAQFQSDRSVVGVARSLARNGTAIEAGWAEAVCDRGDFPAYARLRAEIAAVEAHAARERRTDRRAESLQTLSILKPGDIVRVPSGRSQGWVVIIDPGTRNGDDVPRPLVLTEDRQVRRLSITDFPTPPAVAGRMKIAKHFNPKEPASRRNLAAAFRSRLSEVDLSCAPDADAHRLRRERADRRPAGRAAPTPLPHLSRPRPALPGGGTGAAAGAGERPARGPHPDPDQHHREPLRQDLPGAGVAGLSDRRGRQPGEQSGPDAGPDLRRAGPGGGGVHPRRGVRRVDPAAARRRAVLAGLRGAAQ